MTDTETVTTLARNATHVIVITGAGISAPSGIRTYRDNGSNWTDPNIEKMSHANRYGNYLPTLWERLWGPLTNTIRAAEPNPAHHALTTWQNHLHNHGGALHVITQNIDGLHQRAGTTDVTEIHGTIATIRCLRCKKTNPTAAYTGPGTPPCPTCGAPKTRPNVVLFGERLSPAAVRATEHAITQADLLLTVGTSGTVHPVAGWPTLANSHGIPTIAINTAPTDGFTHTIVGDCATTLPNLITTIRGQGSGSGHAAQAHRRTTNTFGR